jgi:hypothetical protein
MEYMTVTVSRAVADRANNWHQSTTATYGYAQPCKLYSQHSVLLAPSPEFSGSAWWSSPYLRMSGSQRGAYYAVAAGGVCAANSLLHGMQWCDEPTRLAGHYILAHILSLHFIGPLPPRRGASGSPLDQYMFWFNFLVPHLLLPLLPFLLPALIPPFPHPPQAVSAG